MSKLIQRKINYGGYLILQTCGILGIFRYKIGSKYPNQYRGLSFDKRKPKMCMCRAFRYVKSKKVSNDQELIQSDPISCPQNQKGNN